MDLKSLIPFGRRELGAAADPLTAMRREMDRMLEEMGRAMPFAPAGFGLAPRGTGTSPRLDVRETEAGLEVEAELPGVEEQDIGLELQDGVLTIRGEKRQAREAGDQDKGWYLTERAYGAFLRQLPLPFAVEEDKVAARFEKGVLRVTLPRSAEARARARKIEIAH